MRRKYFGDAHTTSDDSANVRTIRLLFCGMPAGGSLVSLFAKPRAQRP